MLKLSFRFESGKYRLITVQDNTMLKPCAWRFNSAPGLITVQDNTMLKLYDEYGPLKTGLITVQDNTMLKLLYRIICL